MHELNVGGSNMTVELDGNTLSAKANTGNKQWVAVITDTHPKYNYDRDFVAYQKPKTSDRDSGTATVEDGVVIERVRYTHSGKNRKDQFYQLVDGEAYEIDEGEVTAALDGEIVPDIEEETHECEECGDEFDSEHGLAVHQGVKHSDDGETESNTEEPTMTESNTDSTSPKAMADGGTEQIRDSNEVRHSDDEVRRYSADGHLYAYREGDEHVVVSRGNESRTRWTKRVPAERDAVLAGEHLWTVPENWEHRVNIKGAAEARYAIYHIPETGVDVLVTVPNKNHLVDAWYGVKRVGNLTVTYDDEIAWDELETLIENARDVEEVSDDAVEALETLHRRRRSFERKFAEGVDMYAEEALFERAHEPVSVQEWTTDPWGDIFHVDDLVQDFLDLDNETRDEVLKNLEARNVIPHYPAVRVDVEEGEGVPDGYDIRALVEAGASGAETIDYLITEHYDLMTQTDWAEVRGKGSSAISKNVSGAKSEFSD
jgi:hypothetical protein